MNNGKLPIIAFEYAPWFSSWSGRQHILSRLGKRGWPVVYSNGAKFYNEINLGSPWGRLQSTDHIQVYQPGSFPPRNYRFRSLDRAAISVHCRHIKKNLGLRKGDPFIAFCFHPAFYPYIEELNAPYTMFHIFDVYRLIGNTGAGGSNVKKLIDRSDLVTAASETMWTETVEDKRLTAKYVYNGVDTSAFQEKNFIKGAVYDAISKLGGPKVGYLGAINCKLDFTVFDHLAGAFPDTRFVILGAKKQVELIQEDAQNWAAYLSFFNRPNVHYMGTIDRTEIPGCLDLMDATLAPYKMDKSTWAFAAFPLKINEYLAAGKPVISSYTTTIEQHFGSAVAMCREPAEWQHALADALAGRAVGTEESRRLIARENDWEKRVDKLEYFMFAMLADKNRFSQWTAPQP